MHVNIFKRVKAVINRLLSIIILAKDYLDLFTKYQVISLWQMGFSYRLEVSTTMEVKIILLSFKEDEYHLL